MDPQQQQALNQFAGLGAGIFIFAAILGIALYAFLTWLFWRCFTKAGLSGPLSLLNLLYPIGPLICLCILAFSKWKVVPEPTYGAGMTPYPQAGYPPAYPPAAYPQTTPVQPMYPPAPSEPPQGPTSL